MAKIRLTEKQFKDYCRKIMQESKKEKEIKSLIREFADYESDEDFTPGPLKGNFTAYQENSDVPIVGIYYYHIEEERQTYDNPGYKDYILDDVKFVGLIPQDIKDTIVDTIESNLQIGEDGDMEFEF